MIDVSSPGQHMLTLATDPAALQHRLVPGQRLMARVVDAIADNQFTLVLGGIRVVAASAQPLVVGQQLAVDVTGTDAAPGLRLASASTPPSTTTTIANAADADQRLALAALVTAVRQTEVDRPRPTSARTLLTSLATALPDGLAQLTAKDLTPVAHLLPIELDEDVTALATRLKAAFEGGGQLFDSHLRTLLDAAPGMSSERALDLLHEDARVLLGRAATALAEGQTSGEAVVEAGHQLEAVTSQILAQQARLGLDWVAHGIVNIEVPVRLPSGDTRASITVQRDPDASDDGEHAAPAFRATFRIVSEALGPVDTRVSWMGSSVNTAICVNNLVAHALLEPELPSLRDGLSATFARVSADLRVDPSGTAQASTSTELPDLPGGSLLDVRG